MESILEKGLQILAGALPTPPVLLLIGIVPRALEQVVRCLTGQQKEQANDHS